MLKTWGETANTWTRSLSASTTVSIADDDVGAGGFDEKPWFILLAQTGEPTPVRTDLPGRHILLTREEARELVDYLLSSGELLQVDVDDRKVFIVDDAERHAAFRADFARLKRKKTRKTRRARPQKRR